MATPPARLHWTSDQAVSASSSRIFHLWEDLDFAFNALRSMGGEFGVITAVVTSPFFAIGLVLYGVLHLIFVGEPSRVLRHQVWTYIGWSIFSVCLTAIIVTAGWGALQAYIQTRIQSGIETRQLPDRRLSQDEINHIQQVFRPIANEFPNSIQVEAVSASPDAAGYALQFMQAFHASGLTINGITPTDNNITSLFPSSAQVVSSQMRGLYIGIMGGTHITKLPERAIKFLAALREAGFTTQLTGWQGVGADDFVFVVSYR
jgi:hypothetical protein